MTHTLAKGAPLWSNKQLKAEAENIVVGELSVNATYKVLQMIREEYEAERRQLQARIVDLEQQLAQAGQRSAGEQP